MKECIKCKTQIPCWVVVEGKKRNLNNRKYCLRCKPFGTHDHRNLVKSQIGFCVICGRETSVRRRKCGSCNTKIRRHRSKLSAIKYLGGKCVRCGYDRHWAALEFHHKSGRKDFTIGDSGKSWETIRKELDKCELVCSCCHRIEHSNRDDKVFLQEVENYKGTQFKW